MGKICWSSSEISATIAEVKVSTYCARQLKGLLASQTEPEGGGKKTFAEELAMATRFRLHAVFRLGVCVTHGGTR